MSDVKDLVSRVAARAAATSGPMSPEASREEVPAAERALGFRLPALLVSLYRDVTNGGVGPDHQPCEASP
ncbi:hypothetical protein ACFQ8C_27150 [Streptomyces sp. NPDC056503]|uniref:hypothetical protein n=1 Tax=Streptomyces sp. NPDC056503 TaxID=3345842 RepID=UPI0036B9C6D7